MRSDVMGYLLQERGCGATVVRIDSVLDMLANGESSEAGLQATCSVLVEVSDCLSETEARETAANLAGIKMRTGGFAERSLRFFEVQEYDNGEGRMRWQAKGEATGFRS